MPCITPPTPTHPPYPTNPVPSRLPAAGCEHKAKYPAATAPPETSEARFGPWLVRPACGVLPGRGLKLPRTQTVSGGGGLSVWAT